MPTLGQIAEKSDDFAPLRVLLSPVAQRPVDELGEDLRSGLLKRGGDEHELLLQAFLGACDAAVRRVEGAARKRPRPASSSEEEPGEGSSAILLFSAHSFSYRAAALSHLAAVLSWGHPGASGGCHRPAFHLSAWVAGGDRACRA